MMVTKRGRIEQKIAKVAKKKLKEMWHFFQLLDSLFVYFVGCPKSPVGLPNLLKYLHLIM
jgi:hypothetical protein